MIKVLVMVAMMAMNTQTTTVVETCDDVMMVETKDGNLYEYEFDGMTDAEKYAETVLLINNRVVVI